MINKKKIEEIKNTETYAEIRKEFKKGVIKFNDELFWELSYFLNKKFIFEKAKKLAECACNITHRFLRSKKPNIAKHEKFLIRRHSPPNKKEFQQEEYDKVTSKIEQILAKYKQKKGKEKEKEIKNIKCQCLRCKAEKN